MADPAIQNPFSGLLTTEALKTQREQQALQQAGDNPWLQMAARSGLQLGEIARGSGHFLTPDDIRARRTDALLAAATDQYNQESKKDGSNPDEILSRLTTDAFHKFLDAGDVESAAVLAPHVFQSLAQEAELAKLKGTDAASRAKQKLEEAKQALDERQAAETERHNKAVETLGRPPRTQVITSIDPDTGQPINQVVDLTTGQLVNDNVSPKPAAGGGAGGGRAQTQFDRIHGSAQLATKTLENLTQIPVSTNRGAFGSAAPGTTLAGSTMTALANKVTATDSQRYKVLTSGLRRNLATLEAQGAAQGLAGLTKMMDQVESIPGDDYLTQVSRLAETKQIIEESLKAYQSHPNISQPQQAAISALIDRVEKAIPYTQDDITKLQYDPKFKGKTLNDVIRARSAAADTGGSADFVFNPATGKLEPKK